MLDDAYASFTPPPISFLVLLLKLGNFQCADFGNTNSFFCVLHNGWRWDPQLIKKKQFTDLFILCVHVCMDVDICVCEDQKRVLDVLDL